MANKEKKIPLSFKTFFGSSESQINILAWALLVILLFITLGEWITVKKDIDFNARINFNFRTSEVETAIKKRMQAYEQILLGGTGLFDASDTVTFNDWHNYFKSLRIEKNYPGILGFGFAEYVTAEEKEQQEQRVRQAGHNEYKIWPDGDRPVYTPIIYLEPYSGRNLRAYGYDMFSNSTRRAAMEKARDSASTFISGKVLLVQETNENIQAGFLMYLPVYKSGIKPVTVQDRREEIEGYVYSPFRMDDLMQGILGRELANIALKIYDGVRTNNKSLMYASDSSKIFSEALFTSTKTISLNGKKWTLIFASLPSFENMIDWDKPLIVLFGGIAISILFFLVVLGFTATRRVNLNLEQILESTGEGIFGIDLKGRCTFINRSAAEMIGYPPQIFINSDMHEMFHHTYKDGRHYPKEECPMIKSIKSKESFTVDNEVFWRADGTFFPVEYSHYPIIKNDEVKGGVITFTDITERKKNLEQIQNSLREKEVLLKEVHHRVKNNLQIISSLLNLQSQYISDKHARELFHDSQNRIRSMALIHEKLYQSRDMSKIDFGVYINELIGNLFSSYRYRRDNFELIVDMENIFLSIDTAITLGLIINELVSNSLKHAFKESDILYQKRKAGGLELEKDVVKISMLKLDDENYELRIKDNGIGVPENFDFRNTPSLGLQLVITLVEQIEGVIELLNEYGTEFIIKFKINS